MSELQAQAQRAARINVLVAALVSSLVAGCGIPATSLVDLLLAELPQLEASLHNGNPFAYTEAQLKASSELALGPGHTAVLRLEPHADMDDVADDGEHGVERVPYYFDRETAIALRVHDDAEHVSHAVLRHWSGFEVHRHTRGEATQTTVLAPGLHILEIHHARKGELDAPARVVFVRPIKDAGDAAKGAGPRSAGADAVTFEVGHDCKSCQLQDADLRGYDFSGVNMTLSNFTGAKLADAKFVGTECRSCKFSVGIYADVVKAPHRLDRVDFTGARLDNADFSAAAGDQIVFRNATMPNAHFGSVWHDMPDLVQPAAITNADFRGATLTHASFVEADLTGSTFDGADLSEAVLRGIDGGTPHTDVATGEPVQLTLKNVSFRKNTETGAVTSFSFADMKNVNFEGADLTDANFEGVTAPGSRFKGANLTRLQFFHLLPRDIFANQDLTGTNFTGVDLGGDMPGWGTVDLRHANFTDAIICDPNGGDVVHFGAARLNDAASGINFTRVRFPHGYDGFRGKDLANINLSGALMETANLEGAKLVGVQLRGAHLPGANLRGADLSGANLDGANLRAADLENATLVGTHLIGAKMAYCSLRRANMTSALLGVAPGPGSGANTVLAFAYMPDVNLSGADLRSADFSSAHVYATGDPSATTLFTANAQLDAAVFTNAILSGAQFDGSATAAVFSGAQLVNCTFNGCDLRNAKFDNAYLQGADFSGAASSEGITFLNSAFALVPGGWTYTDNDGLPRTYAFGATVLAGLALDATITWPSGDSGAFVEPYATPSQGGPYPPQPACHPHAPDYSPCPRPS